MSTYVTGDPANPGDYPATEPVPASPVVVALPAVPGLRKSKPDALPVAIEGAPFSPPGPHEPDARIHGLLGYARRPDSGVSAAAPVTLAGFGQPQPGQYWFVHSWTVVSGAGASAALYFGEPDITSQRDFMASAVQGTNHLPTGGGFVAAGRPVVMIVTGAANGIVCYGVIWFAIYRGSFSFTP